MGQSLKMSLKSVAEFQIGHTILFVDPGTVRAGWCVGAGRDYLASGCWTLKKSREKKPIWDRVHEFSLLLRAAIEDHFPDVIGIEWPMGPGGNAAKIKLGMILGAVAAEAGQAGLPVLEINPTSIKEQGVHKDALPRAEAIVGRKVKRDEADAIGGWLALSAQLYGLTLEEAEGMWGHCWSTR